MKFTMTSFLIVALLAFVGCSTTTTTHGVDENGLATDIVTTHTVDMTIDNSDVGVLGSLFDLASRLWGTVQEDEAAPVEADGGLWDTLEDIVLQNLGSVLGGGKAVVTEDDVKAYVTGQSLKIGALCINETGKLPPDADVLLYLKSNTEPSAKALIRFAETGLLFE